MVLQNFCKFHSHDESNLNFYVNRSNVVVHFEFAIIGEILSDNGQVISLTLGDIHDE